MNINDFLKELLGEETFSTIEDKLKESKAKFVDLKEGQYVDKDKFDAIKTQLDGLSEDVKKFDGVDLEGLKKQASDWEEKYNNDLLETRKTYEMKDRIRAKGLSDNVMDFLKRDKISLDGDSFTGLDEQLDALMNIFPKKEDPVVKGVPQGNPAKTYNIADIQKMTTAEINANWSKPEFQEALKQQK